MAADNATIQRLESILAAHFGAEDGARAVQRWQRQYAQQPGGGLVGFVQELARTHGLEPTARHRLRMELFRAIYEDVGEARPAGRDKAGKDTSQGQAAQPEAGSQADDKGPRSPGQQVCAALMVSMLGQARQADRSTMLERAVEYADESGALEAPVAKRFRQWNGDGEPPVSATDDGLQALVHAGYLALCELYGPADADRLLRRCVQKVESMSAAVEYPPDRLL